MPEERDERARDPWEEDPWEREYPYQYFEYEVNKREKIATVTLTNPAAGDSAPFWTPYQGIKAINRWERDDDVKVVIIKGGGKNFCTGHDLNSYLKEHGARSGSRAVVKESKHRRPNRWNILLQRDNWLFGMRLLCSLKPTIMQVHGLCLEYGHLMQLHGDMTIAGDDAHFGHLGQVMGISGIGPFKAISNLIGYKRYREMMTCGRTVSAREAAEMGLINRVVPRERLNEEAWNEARRIAMVPLDGLVSGKAFAHMALEEMGVPADELRAGYMWAGFALSIVHQPGEFSFLDVVREEGLKQAMRRRKELYAPLGGFGLEAERDRVEPSEEKNDRE